MTDALNGNPAEDTAPAAVGGLHVALGYERAVHDARKQKLMQSGLNANNKPTVGLALSGGGIRSATFSLGILQALSKNGLIPKIDYISTVSGGSYIGSFFGSLFIDPRDRFGSEVRDQAAIKQLLETPLQTKLGRRAVGNLREFGRYLTPGGASDLLLGVAIVGRNWAAVQVVLGLIPLLAFLIVDIAASAWGLSSLQLLLIPAVLAYLTLSIGSAYWFTRREYVPVGRPKRVASNIMFMSLLAVMCLAGLLTIFPALSGLLPSYVARTLKWGAAALLPALIILLIFEWRYGKAQLDEQNANQRAAAIQAEDTVRSHLSRALATCVLLTIISLCLFVISLLGGKLADTLTSMSLRWTDILRIWNAPDFWGAVGRFVVNFWPLVMPVLPIFLTMWGHSALRRQGYGGLLNRSAGQTILGFSVLIFWLIQWNAVAHLIPSAIAGDAASIPALHRHDSLHDISVIAGGLYQVSTSFLYRLVTMTPALWTAIAVAIIIGAISWCFTFLNLSSLSTLYASRLKRAYIGASNPNGLEAAYDTDRKGDQVPMKIYFPHNNSLGGPMHLINVTIAQTVAEGSNVVAYDRKGKAMHIGPAGVVFEGQTPGSTIHKTFRDCEDLPLSTWTAISGAAASTAIGSQSSIGFSVLAMMTNVRLGYWWKANDKRAIASSMRGLWDMAADKVYGYLFNELQGSFKADNRRRRWYLTDGGHFENTGAYPLLQRRLPFIIISDNGADPKYRMDDILRLMIRARADLGVDIEFMSSADIDAKLGAKNPLKGWIGTYDQLSCVPAKQGTTPGPATGTYAALARIRYPDTGNKDEVKEGLLLVVKPRLSFFEPPELLGYYRRARQLFPQQTTADQFFDEEQWEAYRRFGEFVGEKLFGTPAASGQWCPATMTT